MTWDSSRGLQPGRWTKSPSPLKMAIPRLCPVPSECHPGCCEDRRVWDQRLSDWESSTGKGEFGSSKFDFGKQRSALGTKSSFTAKLKWVKQHQGSGSSGPSPLPGHVEDDFPAPWRRQILANGLEVEVTVSPRGKQEKLVCNSLCSLPPAVNLEVTFRGRDRQTQAICVVSSHLRYSAGTVS